MLLVRFYLGPHQDDEDDQVTRIAGLVISNTVELQNQLESIKEFDFRIDLKNYNFRPEQKRIIEKLDFKITSTTLHCKVMINDEITPTVLSNLSKVLPSGEQGVIFTCMTVSNDVLNIIKNDKTIQVIDESALLDWCATSSTTPCRKGSIAKIRYGDNIGNIVLVNSLSYESSLATVEIIKNSKETLIPIGSIEEIFPNISTLDDFEAISKNYIDFLRLLEDAAPNSFEEGMNMEILAIYDKREELLKNTNPELFNYAEKYIGPHTSQTYEISSHYKKKFIQFRNVYVEIAIHDPLNLFKCTCAHVLNESEYKTLCPHLVATLDYLCREGLGTNKILQNIEKLKTGLLQFRFNNMKRIVETLSFTLGSKQDILKSYIKLYQS